MLVTFSLVLVSLTSQQKMNGRNGCIVLSGCRFFFVFFCIYFHVHIHKLCVCVVSFSWPRSIHWGKTSPWVYCCREGGGVTGQHEELTGVGSIFLTPLAALFSRSERIQPKKEGRECARFSVCFLLLHRRVKSETRCFANANRQKVPSPFIFTSTFWLLPSFLFGL